MEVLRPIKVGDFVTVGPVLGQRVWVNQAG